MKVTTLIPVLALASTLASAAPYQPHTGNDLDHDTFKSVIPSGNGNRHDHRGYGGDGDGAWTHHSGAGIEPRNANDDDNDVLKRAADPFYSIHPDTNSKAPQRGNIMSHFAKGYGFGHGPVVQTTRPKGKIGRREAMAEPEPEPQPEALAEPEAAPASAPELKVRAVAGFKNNNGKKGKTPTAHDLCDARHMVCPGLQSKFYGMYGIFQNTKRWIQKVR
ncbi:hypothetical protein A1O1_04479 [Capronia coronata CBS 617.96]|uniref:Uncharacterized protein n=1 Tax=Capronia coronata CBS 617.96 TaxID=1182541 RepID=W9YEU2_9EURO|nr:uncharacterized protein A1O1_04479 [Capronia coronata CBS 617.96]EXJ91367.1 hypothetical protein A1O1_04479 [Capronia coronata CBS 617.96]